MVRDGGFRGVVVRIGEALGGCEAEGDEITCGSDYHGKNKLVRLADTGLDGAGAPPEGLLRFLEDTESRVLFLADEPKEQMIRADSVTSGSHRFLACVFDDEVQFVGNL